MSPFYDEFIDKDERKMNKTRSFNEKKKGKKRKKTRNYALCMLLLEKCVLNFIWLLRDAQ